ncbi:hypothetical protein MCEMSEM23_02843 [Rhabdaerophilaceae bacterium]
MSVAGEAEQGRNVTQGTSLLATFTLAIFTSAFLLFFIQPMFTKMVLPHLGGSPAVWSIAMVVFQALLLAGYGYAHLSTTRLSTRHSALVHIALLLVTLVALPIAVSDRFGAPPAEGQAVWLIGVFLVSVGLPFFAVAGNGPLLQAWFSRSGHPHSRDPYFLYGASNLGSFAALLLYPVLFEPLFSVKMQAQGWAFGFGLLIVFIGLSALQLCSGTDVSKNAVASALPSPKPTVRQVFAWVAFSFIPSGLMVAVTAHISTDVAAAPFLWVIPLALFLLTFVLIFRDKPLLPMVFLQRILPILAASLVLFSYFGTHMFVVVLLVNCGFFFVATMVCHHQLYALRPSADRLTAFYLWMSVGGVLGGLFCGLLAPVIFSRVLEYPILAVLAIIALPTVWQAERARIIRIAAPILVAGAAFFLAITVLFAMRGQEPTSEVYLAFLVVAAIAMILYRFPIAVAALLVVLFSTLDLLQRIQGGRTYERSFFGVHKVDTRENGQFRVLSHGTTVHGAIRIVHADGTPATGRPKPLTYYHPDAPIADTLQATLDTGKGRSLGVVGLGTGAHSCNGTDADRWTYFEIDPLVVKIAQDRSQFRFLAECAPATRIVLGDARLTLAQQPEGYFDNLLIDAFSSDSIPVHLLTREALSLYMSRLVPAGILTLHISNRHLELESVVASLARELGLSARIKRQAPPSGQSFEDPVGSIVVALARHPETLATIDLVEGWRSLEDRRIQPWTDDFSNIVTAIWRRYVG